MKRILILLVCFGVCLWAVAYAVFDMLACISFRLASVAAIVAAYGVAVGLIWSVAAIVDETDGKGEEEEEEEDNNDE